MSARNLAAMFARADRHDLTEGMLAYERYNKLMFRIAKRYDQPMSLVVAGFVSLSPNSDYIGNLRSLISVLEGIKNGVPVEDIVVSTYKHCRDRAHAYITKQKSFLELTHGPKVLSFYHNVLYPADSRYVTVDGHVVAAWRGKNLTMKEAIIKRRSEYTEIADAIKRLAFREYMLPNQYQATLWFARKRSLGIRYDPQLSLFGEAGDLWRTSQHLDDIPPYSRNVQCRASISDGFPSQMSPRLPGMWPLQERPASSSTGSRGTRTSRT